MFPMLHMHFQGGNKSGVINCCQVLRNAATKSTPQSARDQRWRHCFPDGQRTERTVNSPPKQGPAQRETLQSECGQRRKVSCRTGKSCAQTMHCRDGRSQGLHKPTQHEPQHARTTHCPRPQNPSPKGLHRAALRCGPIMHSRVQRNREWKQKKPSRPGSTPSMTVHCQIDRRSGPTEKIPRQQNRQRIIRRYSQPALPPRQWPQIHSAQQP
mmetsp:Transcript_91518/g.245112  ORF Transcript_91518/g.245112 Transcript_91518/m.245112 type:complete len:212 (-) Transcript_91518:343-978(-)